MRKDTYMRAGPCSSGQAYSPLLLQAIHQVRQRARQLSVPRALVIQSVGAVAQSRPQHSFGSHSSSGVLLCAKTESQHAHCHSGVQRADAKAVGSQAAASHSNTSGIYAD